MELEFGAKCEQQGLIAREIHSMRFPRMTPNLTEEAVLIVRTGSEAAIALKHHFHDLSGDARNAPLNRGKMPARNRDRGFS